MVRCFVLLCLLVLSFSSVANSQSFAPFSQKLQSLVNRIDQAELQFKEEHALAEAYANKHGLPVNSQLLSGESFQLQSIMYGAPLYYFGQSLISAKTLRSNIVWSGGGAGLSLNGSGQTLGVWDEGRVRTTHQEFVNNGTSRVSQGDNASTISMHTTHVSGTMIAAGVSGPARGMANAALIKAYDWNSDQSEMRTAATSWLKTSNHSYGYITGWIYGLLGDSRWAWVGNPTISSSIDYRFGFYSSASQQWDQIANDYPYYLVCKAAGNDRGEGPSAGTQHWVYQNGAWALSTVTRDKDGGSAGFDCIEGSALAKNLLTVGAVYPDTNYTGASSVTMSSFSGWGPTDDGRIKPDIVSMGVSEYSTYGTADNSYAYMSGTSMATPGVTGSIGLLLQHHVNIKPNASPMRSSTVKGLIIHSADEAGSAVGPDYKFGWGLVNISRAASIMTQNAARSSNWDVQEKTLQNGQTLDISGYSSGTAPVRVTIAWNDPAGTPTSASLNPTNAMLVNDLDLKLLNNASTFQPYILDPSNPNNAAATGNNTRDNVEQVYISQPSQGSYTIRLSHKGTLSGSAQIVSVIISGLEPPGIIVNAGSAATICKGASKTLQGSVTGGTNPSFAWTVLGSSTVLGTALSLNVSPTATTTYRLTATDASQSSSATVTISVVDIPVANAGANVTINSGQSATVVATTASNASSTQYSWCLLGTTTVLSASTSLTVQPTTSSAYVLKAKAYSADCSSMDTAYVTVNAVSVSANAGVDKTVCAGTSFTATGTGTGNGTLSYRWIDAATSQILSTTQNLTNTPTSTKSYIFKVTDQSNQVACDTMVVTVIGQSGALAAFVSSMSPCKGATVQYSADSIAGMSYVWTCTNGTIVGASTTRKVYVNWSSSATSGSLSVTATLQSCTKSRTETIQLIALPNPNFNTTTSCTSETVSYTSSDASGVSYNWSLPGGGGNIVSGANARTVSVSWTSAGSRTIKLIEYKNNTSCSSSVTKNVTVNSRPTPSISVNNSASPRVGQTRVYSVSSVSGSTYAWSVSGGTISNGQGSNQITVTWTNPGNGSVNIVQTKTSTGCSGYATRSVNILARQSLTEFAPMLELVAYPNPAQNILNLDVPVFDSERELTVSISTLSGQQLITRSENSVEGVLKMSFDISNWGSGMYIVTILNGESRQKISFVKH